MMPHTKVVHKGYLSPYSLTSRVGLGQWPGYYLNAPSQCALQNASCVWLTPWIQTTEKTSGFSRTNSICRRYCVAYVFTKELRILWCVYLYPDIWHWRRWWLRESRDYADALIPRPRILQLSPNPSLIIVIFQKMLPQNLLMPWIENHNYQMTPLHLLLVRTSNGSGYPATSTLNAMPVLLWANVYVEAIVMRNARQPSLKLRR